MKILPKNLCKKLSVVNGIGVCSLKDCVCNCWLCEYKDKCSRLFDKCSLKSADFKEIPNASRYYDQATTNLDKQIERIIETEDNEKIIGGLLFQREQEILHCFREAPGDLPSSVAFINSYINQDISTIDSSEIKPNRIATKIWNLVILKEVCSTWSLKLRNKDTLYFGDEEGEEELEKKAANPESIIEEMTAAVETNVFPTVESQHVKEIYSVKMLPAMEWCLSNIHQADMMDYTLTLNFKKIVEHMSDAGTTGEISPNICYRLAYPHYSGMIHVCRYVYSKYKHVKEVSQLNKDIFDLLKSKYPINLDVKKMYDNFLMTLWGIEKSEKVCISEKIGKDTQDYQFIIKDGSLFGSVLLLGFIAKNYESVCSKPYERGRIFEDFVENELSDRQVNVLWKNLETPKGEIDFICSKHEKIFFIEAKDYSPWFDDHYVSSQTYNERIRIINEKLVKSTSRIQWADSNRSKLGLPLNQKIQGVILTRFIEPHITLPNKFSLVSIDNLDGVFGKSRHPEIHETNFKFKIGKEQIMNLEKKVLKEKDQEYLIFGLK